MKQKLKNTLFGFKENFPIIIGVVLLISMMKYSFIFSYLKNLKDDFFSVLMADIIGSIAAGNPINSYVIASQIGNLQNKIIVITTFLVARVTVGLLQIPAEVYFFGRKFTFLRNIMSFIFAVLVGLIVYLLV